MSNQPMPPRTNMTLRQLLNSRFRKQTLVAAGIAMVLITLLVGSQFAEPRADKDLEVRPMPVTVITAKVVETVTYPRTFTGLISSAQKSRLSFERAAKINKIRVDDGQTVAKNDVLAELDIEDLTIRKNELQQQITAAKALRKELKDGPRKETIASVAAEANALRTEFAQAKSNRQRREILRQEGAISAEEWDAAEAKYNATNARLIASEKRLEELTTGTRKEKILAQVAVVKQMLLRLEALELDITKSKLTAPYEGTISKRYVDEGEMAAAGMPILELTQDSHLEARIGVPSNLIPFLLEIKQPLTAKVNGVEVNVKLARILPESDAATRTIPVVFTIESMRVEDGKGSPANGDTATDSTPTDSRIRPGQLVRIVIKEKRKRRGIWIPTVALTPAGKGLWSVFVVRPKDNQQRVSSEIVEVIHSDGELSLVQGTLIDGDRVVVAGDKIVANGVHRIAQGQEVTIVKTKTLDSARE